MLNRNNSSDTSYNTFIRTGKANLVDYSQPMCQNEQKNELAISIHGQHQLKFPTALAEMSPLYRGCGLGFEQVFSGGFKAPGTNPCLLLHALPPAGNFLADSSYISTTPLKNIAIKFPQSLLPGNEHSFLYEIHATKSPIDVAKELAPEVALGNIENIDYESITLHEQERAFVSQIRPNEIKGGWKIKHEKIKMSDPKDFSFLGKLLSPEFIDELCYQKNRIASDEFVPNPDYIPQGHTFFKCLKAVAGVGTIAAVAEDTWSLEHAFKEGEVLGDHNNTQHEAVRIAGGWAAALAGGAAYAEIGATICAPIIPPYGSIVCGFAGGIAGSTVGYFAGSQIATQSFDAHQAGIQPSSTAVISQRLDSPIGLPPKQLNPIVEPIERPTFPSPILNSSADMAASLLTKGL